MAIKRLTAIALLFPLFFGAAMAETTPACASLCGEWQLDAGASDRPDQMLDTAFGHFKEPRVHRPSRPYTDNIEALGRAADEEALGPILDRPRSAELRAELKQLLRQPGLLKITGGDDDIRISGDDASQQSVTPGDSHTRVDLYGTARIEARWRGSQLTVSEKYDRRNRQETTYTVVKDHSLHVSQVIARPGLPRVTVSSVYRRP